jgi:hypothetical protein
MLLPANRLPSGPVYDEGREPQIHCSEKGCQYLAYEPGELGQCIECGRRFCGDHLTAIGSEKYCSDHAKCACGQPAIESCVECGEVKCERCIGDRDLCEVCQ